MAGGRLGALSAQDIVSAITTYQHNSFLNEYHVHFSVGGTPVPHT